MKTKYIATAPNGQEITRTSTRVYTHAVLVTTDLAWAEAKLAEIRAKYQAAPDVYRNPDAEDSYYLQEVERAKAGTWGTIGFCGRLDLAEKLYNRSRPLQVGWGEMVIVEVHSA